MPNAYVWWQGGREGGQKSPKHAYVIHGCSLSRYIDKWLNTDNTNDPPAPSCGPTQSSPEGAGESLVNTYVPNVDIRNTWEY